VRRIGNFFPMNPFAEDAHDASVRLATLDNDDLFKQAQMFIATTEMQRQLESEASESELEDERFSTRHDRAITFQEHKASPSSSKIYSPHDSFPDTLAQSKSKSKKGKGKGKGKDKGKSHSKSKKSSKTKSHRREGSLSMSSTSEESDSLEEDPQTALERKHWEQARGILQRERERIRADQHINHEQAKERNLIPQETSWLLDPESVPSSPFTCWSGIVSQICGRHSLGPHDEDTSSSYRSWWFGGLFS